MTRTGSTFEKLKPSSWKTFPLDDKEWPLKKESLTKTECSWFFNSPEEPFDRCVFQDLSENPILLRAPVAQLDRATDSGSVGRAFESLRVHQQLQQFKQNLILQVYFLWQFCDNLLPYHLKSSKNSQNEQYQHK